MKLLKKAQIKKIKEFLFPAYVWSKNSFAVFGLMSFIALIYVAILAASLGDIVSSDVKLKEIKPNSTVFYKLDQELPESSDDLSLTKDLFTTIPSFVDLVFAFKKVIEDENVTKFIVNLDEMRLSYAQVQELRGLIKQMSDEGKKTVAYASDFGVARGSMRKYYLAAAFDEVYMQPVGSLAINGVGAEIPFVKSLLNKIGVEADFVRQGKYKNFTETLNRDSMSDDAREMMTSIIKDLSVQVLGDIAKDRKMPVKQLTPLIDKGFFSDEEAVKYGLIDKLVYLDDIAKGEIVKLDDYLAVVNKKSFRLKSKKIKDLKRVALIIASGKIAPAGRDNITADSMLETFETVIKDEKIEAIILRLDTPGGSAVVSESIRNAIVRAKKAGKKVIVSMSGTAASGGYWIASAADKIVANPATLTGSIGVFGGKLVIKQLWNKVGVNWSAVRYGENSGMWSANEKFTKSEKARVDAVMESIYQRFIDRVEKGRKLSRADVLDIAEGRVWTGAQAKNVRLVDALGGIEKAIEITKLQLDLDTYDKILLEKYPEEKTGLEKILDMLEGQASVLSGVLNSDFVSFIKDMQLSAGVELY